MRAVMVAGVDDLDFDNDDGGQLRKKLEKALKTNAELSTAVRGYRAKEILAAGDYSLVKPEDLESVEIDEIEAKAKEVQAQRALQGEAYLVSALKARNLTDEQIQAFVEAQPKPAAEVDREAEERVAQVRQLVGAPAGKHKDDGLQAESAILQHFRNQEPNNL